MKQKIIKSSLILLFGGIITKLLGMVIKIVMSRIVGIKGISYYMMVLPTFSLFMSIGQLGLPISLSRIVALDDKNNLNLYFSVIPICLLFNIFLMVILFLSSSFISTNLLHNPSLKYSLIAVGLVLPFTSLSSLCRSYFIGKEKMFPSILSNIFENITRLLFIIFIIPRFLHLDLEYIVFLLIVCNIFSEIASTVILLLFIPRNINYSNIIFSIKSTYYVLKTSIYNLLSNLVGNISYFLEPIILTNILIFAGYTSKYISINYGVITGYVLPLIYLPTFFTSSISQAILSSITKNYNLGNYTRIKKILMFIILTISIFGIIIAFLYCTIGDKLLYFLYKSSIGFNYLKILIPFFILYYLQAPLIMTLQAMGKTQDILYLSIASSITKIISLAIYSLFKVGIYSFIFSIITNIFITIYLLWRKVTNYLK